MLQSDGEELHFVLREGIFIPFVVLEQLIVGEQGELFKYF
jgi:hypothetical protein